MFNTVCDSDLIPQLCQNGCLSILFSVGETEKSKVGGNDSHAVLRQKFPDEK
jgi:hypothetical protein